MRLYLIPLCLVLSTTTLNAQPSARDTVSVPLLLKNLESRRTDVVASAARTLGVIFAPGGRGGDELSEVTDKLIERLDSPRSAGIRREAARALGRMQAAKALEKIKLTMQDKDIEVAMVAGEAVGRILPVGEARKYLVEQGGSGNEHMLVAALHGLAPLAKPEDKAFLLSGLNSDNWRAQKDALRGLEQAIRSGADLTEEEYHQAAKVLGSNIVNASNQAVHFFTHIRNDASLAAALAAAEFQDGDDSWRSRARGLRVLYHLGPTTQRENLGVVIRQLGDRTANVTNEAKRILSYLRREHRLPSHLLYPVLIEELEKAESIRLRASIMAEMGGHVDHQFASRVAEVAADTLSKAISEPEEWPARAHSLKLLGTTGYTGSMENVAKCVADDVANVRSAAGRALEELHDLCSAEEKNLVRPILRKYLSSQIDWRKTATAARAAGYFAAADDVAPLASLLGHQVLNVRQAASHALVFIAEGDAQELTSSVAATVTKEVSAPHGRAWEYGAPVLGALEDTKALGLLTNILLKGEWHAQAAAARAVERIAKANQVNDPKLSDALVKAAQSEVLQVQEACDNALRALTAKDQDKADGE